MIFLFCWLFLTRAMYHGKKGTPSDRYISWKNIDDWWEKRVRKMVDFDRWIDRYIDDSIWGDG